MTTTTDEIKFATLDGDQLHYIEHAGIGPACVTWAQRIAICAVLRLDGMSHDELTATRNSVVRHLADLASEARDRRDAEVYDRLSRNMSGITAVIDHCIYR